MFHGRVRVVDGVTTMGEPMPAGRELDAAVHRALGGRADWGRWVEYRLADYCHVAEDFGDPRTGRPVPRYSGDDGAALGALRAFLAGQAGEWGFYLDGGHAAGAWGFVVHVNELLGEDAPRVPRGGRGEADALPAAVCRAILDAAAGGRGEAT
jgi:hypothetical protein